MAHKSNRTSHLPSTPLPRTPVASDLDSSHHPHRRQSHSNHPSNVPMVANGRCTDQADSIEGNFGGNKSVGQETDDDIGDADADEADNEDDDEDGDALAPSGYAFKQQGIQAGLLSARAKQRVARLRKRDKGTGGLEEHLRIPRHTKTSRQNTAIPGEDSDSDDEAYGGIDDFSTSDENEFHLEQREQQNIIEREESKCSSKGPAAASRAVSETSDTWEGFDIEGNLFMSDIPYFDEQFGRTDPEILNSDLQLYQNTNIFDDIESMPPVRSSPSPPARRVHFREPVHPRPESSDVVSDDEDVTCLFDVKEQSEIDPLQSSPFCNEGEEENEDDSRGGYSSGYETDYGDTTDEEDVPKSATKRPQSLLRQPSLSSLEASSQPQSVTPLGCPPANPFKIPTVPAQHLLGPRLGSFKSNPHKAASMVDSTGDNLLIMEAKKPPVLNGSSSQAVSTRTSTANASPTMSQAILPSALNENAMDMGELLNGRNADPMLALGSGYMVNMVNPAPQGQGISGVLDPVYFPMDIMSDVDAQYSFHDDDDDDEDLLNIEDFIRLGDETSDGEDMAPGTALPTPMSSSPTGMVGKNHSKKRKMSDSFAPVGSHGPHGKRKLITS